MAEFTPITTQEEFDSMIKSRLERERNTISKQFEEKLAGYADYDQLKENVQNLTNEKASWESTVNEKAEQIKTLEDQLADANSKVKSYELDNFRTSAAVANNIPFELRNRITGDTEEAINEDAKKLAEIFRAQNNKGIPGFEQNEGSFSDDYTKTGKVNKDRAMKKFEESLSKLNE